MPDGRSPGCPGPPLGSVTPCSERHCRYAAKPPSAPAGEAESVPPPAEQQARAGRDGSTAGGTFEQRDHFGDLSVTVVAATVPSLPEVPVTATVAPAFTSEIDAALLTVVLAATVTFTTFPSEVAT